MQFRFLLIIIINLGLWLIFDFLETFLPSAGDADSLRKKKELPGEHNLISQAVLALSLSFSFSNQKDFYRRGNDSHFNLTLHPTPHTPHTPGKSPPSAIFDSFSFLCSA